MDDLLQPILQNTYSLSSLKRRLRILKSILSNKFFGGNPPESPNTDDSLWINSLPGGFLEKFNKDNISKFFSDIETRMQGLQTVTLYLPFDPPDDAIKEIGLNIRNTFGKPLLLDIRYDPRLIAGCALSWKGIYRDYSLKGRIEERKLAILESFKKFLK